MTPLQWGRSVSGIDYGTRGMGVCADPGSYRWCQALSRSRSSFATNNNYNYNSNDCYTTTTQNTNNTNSQAISQQAVTTKTTDISKSLANRKSTKIPSIDEISKINQSSREQANNKWASRSCTRSNNTENNNSIKRLQQTHQFIILLLVLLLQTTHANIPGEWKSKVQFIFFFFKYLW